MPLKLKKRLLIVISEIEIRHLNDMATKLDLAEIKSELIRWVVAAGFLQTALIIALLLKLVK